MDILMLGGSCVFKVILAWVLSKHVAQQQQYARNVLCLDLLRNFFRKVDLSWLSLFTAAPASSKAICFGLFAMQPLSRSPLQWLPGHGPAIPRQQNHGGGHGCRCYGLDRSSTTGSCSTSSFCAPLSVMTPFCKPTQQVAGARRAVARKAATVAGQKSMPILDHHLSCPCTGLLPRRGFVVERAWVQVAPEAVGPEGREVAQQSPPRLRC